MTEPERATGALLGAFVGDAAALGLHWIYDPLEVARRAEGTPAFQAPAEDHYHAGRRPGELTHYGDGALVLMRVLAEPGPFDPDAYARQFSAFFLKYDGYLDHATKGTLARMEREGIGAVRGAADDQIGAAAKIPPLVAWAVHRNRELAPLVEAAVRVTHDDDVAVGHTQAAARAIAAAIGGATAVEAFEAALAQASGAVVQGLRDALNRKGEDPIAAVAALGPSCPLPKSLPAAAQVAVSAQSYQEGIEHTILAGGDSAGRAMIVGAVLGAVHGVEGIPTAWLDRLTRRAEIEELARTILT